MRLVLQRTELYTYVERLLFSFITVSLNFIHLLWTSFYLQACKAIQPSFYRMSALYPHITFLEVPVTNHNVNLHQGLEVPSLPYGHIYYPDAGLVEEMKISKKYFPGLVKNVRWYDEGLCGLDELIFRSLWP